MTAHVHHDLKIAPNRDELARQSFATGLRVHVLNHMADRMKQHYENAVEPAFKRTHGRPPADGQDVHKAMKPEAYFRFYSGLRVNAQEMVWASVRPTVERALPGLRQTAAHLSADQQRAHGSVTTDEAVAVPDHVSAMDVHLMPGCYHLEAGADDIAAGVLYDNGLSVFSMGLMGDNLDDIGSSITAFIHARYPDFKPARILDMGCTIGHNTLPWARTYPEAEVTGVDISAPCVRYAHARAQSQGVTAHFRQADATATGLEDASVDLVFSSMLLHELPKKQIADVFREARRVLKPGGLMLHMELPPNNQMSAYEGFYLDWDCFYNQEPYYKGYRDQDPRQLCADAGFDPDGYVQFVVPSIGVYGADAVRAAVDTQDTVDDETTGRLAEGIRWFVYGAWA